jgi:hypothetical protein
MSNAKEAALAKELEIARSQLAAEREAHKRTLRELLDERSAAWELSSTILDLRRQLESEDE